MRILLTTLNARFSHSSLALRYLRAVLREIPGIDAQVLEYTVNQSADDILYSIYSGHYDCVCFSTYIWNVEPILRIACNLKKVAPETRILLGGPEVTFSAAAILRKHPFIDGILMGEGEDVIRTLFTQSFEKPGWQSVAGTAWNTDAGLRVNPTARLIQNLDTIPFPYDDEDALANRLVYYESSRGCPYRCTYCLSSASEGVRFFSLPRVFSDLERLLKWNIQTIKFVDRTFNVDPDRYLPILDFIEARDNGITCFHFEISAGILTDEVIQRCARLRKGLVQFEIGVQSTCPEALKASGRPDWTDRIAANVAKLKAGGNIHLHLDLIAGLPYEGFERFMESFDAVYAMEGDLLQLGFLKLIHGTAMRRNAGFYGFQWREEPPYEVLCTKWISYDELNTLKRIEHLLDRYCQHGAFQRTRTLLIPKFRRPSEFYRQLERWWSGQGCWERNVGQEEAWHLLYRFALSLGIEESLIRSALRWDAICHYKPKAFFGTALAAREPEKALQHQLLHERDPQHSSWQPYGSQPAKQLLKRLHFEVFDADPEASEVFEPERQVIICFDVSQTPSLPVCRWLTSEINMAEQAGNPGAVVNNTDKAPHQEENP